MKQRAPRTARLSLCVLVAMLVCFAVPALASADSVTVRVEGRSSTLVPRTTVTLPSDPVAPTAAPAGATCPGNTVLGAVDVASGHAWGGTWDSANDVWSLDTIKGASAKLADGRKWLVILNGNLVNDAPCTRTLQNNDSVSLYPACLGSTTSNCFTGGLLDMQMPSVMGPGAPINIQVRETKVTLDALGNGSSQQGPSLGATVIGPDGSATTDSRYGTGLANLTITEKGPATITATKVNFAQDHAAICITEGADGYCGTTLPPPVPFDPTQFCQTTGNDGYCGSPDAIPPVGRIGVPKQADSLGKSLTKLSGTVDFDPSLTDYVNLRLVRKINITVKKYGKKRRVWVTKRIHGKRVRKRVWRRKVRKVKQPACYYWSDKSTVFKRMKKCDPATAPLFRAAGAEIWWYEFTSPLPAGAYTLDVQAVDGAGNVDSAPELGRNRVTFSVK